MSSGFITETEALEARRRRQEEWDKVRTEDQPSEAPEEVYDSRPLYQRLEEQKLRKDAEYEEAHKLKNMIRGLDDDEVGFLDLVERSKATAAMKISAEEQREMKEFRERVSSLAETEEMQRLRAQLAPARAPPKHNNATKNMLQGVIVRKRKADEVTDEKDKASTPPAKVNGASILNSSVKPSETASSGVLRCVAILPGLGHYPTDSSSDTSDSDENDKHCVQRDLLGRRMDAAEKRKEEARN